MYLLTVLSGKFRDETGDLLTPTHRHGRRLRYYVSNRLISGGIDPGGWRLSAPGFEKAVVKVIADHLSALAERHKLLCTVSAVEVEGTSKAALDLAKELRTANHRLLTQLVCSGQIAKDRNRFKLKGDSLSKRLGHPVADLNPAPVDFDAPFSYRRGVELKIIAGDPIPAPDQTLIQVTRNTHKSAGELRKGTPLKTIALNQKYSDRHVARIIPLAGLSPRIQTAIVDGDQPAQLTLETLVRAKLPLDWKVQERQLGFL